MPRVYLDPNRAFGGVLNNEDERLAYYRRVIAEAIAQAEANPSMKATGGLCSFLTERGWCH